MRAEAWSSESPQPPSAPSKGPVWPKTKQAWTEGAELQRRRHGWVHAIPMNDNLHYNLCSKVVYWGGRKETSQWPSNWKDDNAQTRNIFDIHFPFSRKPSLILTWGPLLSTQFLRLSPRAQQVTRIRATKNTAVSLSRTVCEGVGTCVLPGVHEGGWDPPVLRFWISAILWGLLEKMLSLSFAFGFRVTRIWG